MVKNVTDQSIHEMSDQISFIINMKKIVLK
jgi:hypothetical protein